MARRFRIATALAAALVATALTATDAHGADAPALSNADVFVNLLRLPNGDIQRVVANSGFIRQQTSTDNGLTWRATVPLVATTGSSNPTPLVDDLGDTHFFQFILRDTNGTATGPNTPLVDRFLDIWQRRTTGGGATWASPSTVYEGYNASMMRLIQLNSGPHTGRIVLPFSDRVTNDTASPTGLFKIRATYSNDRGATWQMSPSLLSSAVPTDWNGSSDGAAEPTVFQKNDGSLQMYARSQVGFLTQSTSTDGGATWSPLVNSSFYTSTGPPNTIRLDDGRLMLFWNNATMPARYNGAIWYAGRDVLHAAISSDDGRTWSGYREIYLDPNRHNAGITTGDTGTAYPFPVATADGKALLITGQSTAKTMVRVDPAWLMETSSREDFSGADPLADWSYFKSFGAVTSVKRDRTAGAALTFDATLNRNVLSLRKPDANDPDGATWNFPMARKGETLVKVKLEPGFQGGSIALGDRFFQPTDIQGEQNAVFKLDIASTGTLSSGGTLSMSTWNDVVLKWDLASHFAQVLVNGNVVGSLQQANRARPGASYLRLRSSAQTIDTNGFRIGLVDQVGLTTGPVRESTQLTPTEASQKLTSPSDWTRFRFDDYVPNAGASGTLLTATGTYDGFARPTTGATPRDLIVSGSAGSVVFSDNTGLQVTSDIVGPKNGGTLTFTFVDHDNLARRAVVSGLSFRFGSTLANDAQFTLYDIDGNVLPDYANRNLPTLTTGGTLGATSQLDLADAPLIHQIVFRGFSNDTWLIGSFANDPAEFDFAYAGLTVTDRFIPSAWKNDASGTWSADANWTINRPNAVGAVATFGPVLTQPRTVTVDAAQSVGQLNFNSAQPFTIAGSAPVSLVAPPGEQASINVTAGAHAMTAPVILASDTTVNVNASNASVTLADLRPTVRDLTKSGLGSLHTGHLRLGDLSVQGGSLRLLPGGATPSTSVVTSLSIAALASFDIEDNLLVVDYVGASPLASMKSHIVAGRLRSSAAAGGLTLAYGEAGTLGVTAFGDAPVDSTSVLVRVTLPGDADLNGIVNFDDLLRLAANYNSASSAWTEGDFNYDGATNFDDLLGLAANYNQAIPGSWALAKAIVPEPTAAFVIVSALVPLRRARERRVRRCLKAPARP